MKTGLILNEPRIMDEQCTGKEYVQRCPCQHNLLPSFLSVDAKMSIYHQNVTRQCKTHKNKVPLTVLLH